MYTLDLDRLNLRSPYYVWKVKDGVYAFDTDYEVSYEIGLSVNVEMLQMEVCAFDINNINHKPSPNDHKLRDLYEIRTVEDVMDDKTPNYGAIIVEKTHPDLELILARFDELAAFLKKPIV